MKRRLLRALALLLLCPLASAEVYRWTDEAGTTHYGDHAPAHAEQLDLAAFNRLQHYRVERVIDGDTIELAGGQRVRLIGINTPELARRERPAQDGGEAAADYLRQRLEGQRIRLEPGVERYDDYRRLLAHLFDEEGNNINAELLRRGLAHTSPHRPNTRYAELYAMAEADARNKGLGIWRLAAFDSYPARHVARCPQRYCRLEGVVGTLERKRIYTYLTMGPKLTLRVANDAWEAFASVGLGVDELPGRRLQVAGWLRRRGDRYLLYLEHPSQLQPIP